MRTFLKISIHLVGHLLILFFFWAPLAMFAIAVAACGGDEFYIKLVSVGFLVYVVLSVFLTCKFAFRSKEDPGGIRYSGKTEDDQCISYIKAARKEGLSEEDIFLNLTSAGWAEDYIQEVFASINIDDKV